MEKREPSYTVGEDVNWYIHYKDQYGGFFKKRVELPYDLAISLLGTHPEKTMIPKDTCTPLFIGALFPICQDMEAT